MIYLCLPSYNEGPTVGLVLWKIRKVFEELGREYQILVGDDGSTDDTAEILESYGKVLPLTVLRAGQRKGYARTVEALLQTAAEASDRPKRDAAVLLHADFSHGPEFIPDMLRRIDSGADVVVAQVRSSHELAGRSYRMLRRWAPWLLRRGVTIPNVRDPSAGFAAFRLITLRNALRGLGQSILVSDGWAANAELLARTVPFARRIESIEVTERSDLKQRPSRVVPWVVARELWRAAGALRRAVPRDVSIRRSGRGSTEGAVR
jgi:dolichol-phosphate mannosyltransferase